MNKKHEALSNLFELSSMVRLLLKVRVSEDTRRSLAEKLPHPCPVGEIKYLLSLDQSDTL